MSIELATNREDRGPAIAIVRGLPESNYAINFQPTYPDECDLIEAVHEVQHTTPVTTPRQVDAARSLIASNTRLAIAGRCAERIQIDPDANLAELEAVIEDMALDIAVEQEVVAAEGLYVYFGRNRGQFAKPRSNATQIHSETGLTIPSWQGDNVNMQNENHRVPDPTLMVAGGLQSRDVEAALTRLVGGHIPAAHEGLLLPFEKASIRRDEVTGRLYLLSGDLIWIGDRTKNPDGPHATMLSQVANPVGVKLGPNTTPELVEAMAGRLYTEEPGRLTWMLRMGIGHTAIMDSTLAAIRRYAPNSRIVWDTHGVTRTVNGVKIRAVDDMVEEVGVLSDVADGQDMEIHGIHVESTADPNSRECVDHHDEMPRDKPDVDPLLNHRQLRAFDERVAPHLMRKSLPAAA
jgi:3-deoxy-7-phosphoheptulonate synthase